RPPLHPRCRSILQLVTKSWKELGIDAEEMPSSTRASQDSPVSEQINYENWLKSKSPEQQDQVLGKGKADLWRRGVITFADMLDQSGRPLTLANLNAKFNTQDGVIKQMRSNWSDDFPDTVIDRKLGDATTLSQILCKHPFQLNGDRLSDHQNQS
ncbi:hypothetical protein Q7Z55_11735, partial [Glaesserella parasuis]|nr:hypothetical protein [Glaesserella parasuis]MDP0280307.1 hypothetical protein [Glaesserella parasuis]MDP0336160.1 hypothetical protein [Glaesserella parasuis]MDP0371447.1 hypothetical protein [Glaesserella parasuis]